LQSWTAVSSLLSHHFSVGAILHPSSPYTNILFQNVDHWQTLEPLSHTSY